LAGCLSLNSPPETVTDAWLHAFLDNVAACVEADSPMGPLGLRYAPEGSYVWLEGVYEGNWVYVEVLAYPPQDEEPGLKVDSTRGRRRPGAAKDG
jgi:hypothetical protein